MPKARTVFIYTGKQIVPCCFYVSISKSLKRCNQGSSQASNFHMPRNFSKSFKKYNNLQPQLLSIRLLQMHLLAKVQAPRIGMSGKGTEEEGSSESDF